MPESFFMPQPATIEKETLAQVFFCELCEILKITFFTEHIRATASEELIIQIYVTY